MTAWRELRKEIEGMDAKFVLAISGGVDSMALVDFFRRSKCEFVVAHFNHQLQPINQLMEKIVREYCEQYSIEFYVGKGVSIKLSASLNHVSVEAEAHQQRYSFLNAVSRAISGDKGFKTYIVTAHHQDDQVESVLLNLFRGVSLDSVFMKKIDGNRYKPLLNVHKSELIEGAISRKLVWVEDPTNEENDADRNWLRNDIIPQIKQRRNIDKTIPLSIEKFLKNK